MNRYILLSILAIQAALVEAWVYPPVKFRSWYPTSTGRMNDAARQCMPELEAYWAQAKNSSTCSMVQNCFLSNLPEFTKANMAASGVLLGLMPTILGFIGPNLEDTAMIMIQRPLLTSLIMLGAPAINPIPVLHGALVDRPVTKPAAVMVALGQKLTPGGVSRLHHGNPGATLLRTRPVLVISVLQYVLALSALAHTMHNTVELDLRSSVVWQCSSVGFPEMWNLFAVCLYWVGAASLWYRVRAKNSPKDQGTENEVQSGEISTTTRSTTPNAPFKVIIRWASVEATPSLFRPRPEWTHRIGDNTVASDLLSWLGSLMVLVHYTYGTAVFSSLLFINVKDAILVFIRYAASAFVCRLLLWFELDSLNLRVQDDAVGEPQRMRPRPNMQEKAARIEAI